ncbi:MAG: 4Fe-4S binding protein [Acidobacteriota bacterium]|nr:4Fe-4S binding protein [Acidobacteriota bacterium]
MEASTPIPAPEASTGKKKQIRRLEPDRSQRVRLIVQSVFILLNIFLCAQFYFFVRYFETGQSGPHVSRPAGVDGWLPIAGLMNTRYFIATGHVPAIHPAAMVLFLVFVVMSLVMKRAFCSWLCPIGTLSEYLWKLGRKLLGRNIVLPRWLDLGLRGIKYLLLAFFVFIVGGMTAAALEDFMMQPYGVLADVKMLHFFLRMSTTAMVIVVVLMLLSVVIKNFWCRYMCPYGALMSLVSAFSPVRIRRDAEACIDCGKCAKACPQTLPVNKLVVVRSVECTACMECVASCGTQNALQLSLPPQKAATAAERWRQRVVSPVAAAILLVVIFLGGVGAARLTHHWQTVVDDQVYREMIPQLDTLSHPGF